VQEQEKLEFDVEDEREASGIEFCIVSLQWTDISDVFCIHHHGKFIHHLDDGCSTHI
jgi:hypothetical protein